MQKRLLNAGAATAALLWAAPGAAQVASASSQASSMVGKLSAIGAAMAVLVLVVLGYFYMTGHGDRQTLALWVAGFCIVASGGAIAAMIT
jgi:hypothetical protein